MQRLDDNVKTNDDAKEGVVPSIPPRPDYTAPVMQTQNTVASTNVSADKTVSNSSSGQLLSTSEELEKAKKLSEQLKKTFSAPKAALAAFAKNSAGRSAFTGSLKKQIVPEETQHVLAELASSQTNPPQGMSLKDFAPNLAIEKMFSPPSAAEVSNATPPSSSPKPDVSSLAPSLPKIVITPPPHTPTPPTDTEEKLKRWERQNKPKKKLAAPTQAVATQEQTPPQPALLPPVAVQPQELVIVPPPAKQAAQNNLRPIELVDVKVIPNNTLAARANRIIPRGGHVIERDDLTPPPHNYDSMHAFGNPPPPPPPIKPIKNDAVQAEPENSRVLTIVPLYKAPTSRLGNLFFGYKKTATIITERNLFHAQLNEENADTAFREATDNRIKVGCTLAGLTLLAELSIYAVRLYLNQYYNNAEVAPTTLNLSLTFAVWGVGFIGIVSAIIMISTATNPKHEVELIHSYQDTLRDAERNLKRNSAANQSQEEAPQVARSVEIKKRG